MTSIAQTTTTDSVQFGERHGLYQAIAQAGPISTIDLSARSSIPVPETDLWLQAQVAAGYVVETAERRYQTWCDVQVY